MVALPGMPVLAPRNADSHPCREIGFNTFLKKHKIRLPLNAARYRAGHILKCDSVIRPLATGAAGAGVMAGRRQVIALTRLSFVCYHVAVPHHKPCIVEENDA